MRVKKFLNELTGYVSHGYMSKATEAASKIEKFEKACESNRAINPVRISRINSVIQGRGMQGAKQGVGDFFKNRRAEIVDARKRTVGDSLDDLDNTSKWLQKDGLAQNAASLFYSGETGKLSKMRIAGVGGGAVGTGYLALSDDDKRRY